MGNMRSAPPPVSIAIILNVDVIMAASLHPSPTLIRAASCESGLEWQKELFLTLGSLPSLLVDETHCNDQDEVQENGSSPEWPSVPETGTLHHCHTGPDSYSTRCAIWGFF